MSEMSDPVTLSVSEKPKPTVIGTPQNSVYTGDNVTLSCNLMSTGWTFFWYKDQKSNPCEGSDTNTTTVTVSNEGQVDYYCKARRGSYYSEMSKPATITVTARPKPEVKVQPADHGFVFTGETVTFSCEIKTGGSWVYHWFRDNNELRDVKGKKIYKIADVKESHKGVYTCKGTQTSDPQYTETSDAVTLTVSEKPKPQLTSSLKGDVLTGNSVTLSCTLTPQSAGWKFYWYKYTQSSETKTETHQYIISSVRVSDGGQHWCRAGRGNPVYYTDYSDVLWVNVIESPKPTVTINPDTQVFIGETVTFRCDVEEGRDTEWTYDWFTTVRNTLNPNPTTKEFSTSYVTDSHRGQYTCRGRRTSDSQMSKMSDSVTLSVSGKPKPTVTVTPQSSVYTGDTVTLRCNLMSTGWTFFWYEGLTWTPLSPEGSYTNTHTVTVTNKGRVNYYCKARRGNYNTERSEPATITVRARPKPEVKVQPADHGFVFTGETVTFSCEIKTRGSWVYQWFRDNNELSDAKGKNIYKISGVQESHKGVYTCKGTQSSDPQYTETSDAVTLTVSEKPKPQLTSSLKGDVLRGNSVTLYCTLTPQSAGWKFYWSKYTGSYWTEIKYTETDSYAISSVILSDGGQYRCGARRGNPIYYTDYSNVLSLNVIESPKPTVTINPDTQVFIGETVTFRCDVPKGRDTEWTYDWFTDSNTFYTSFTKEFSISSVAVSHRGQYTCRGRRTSDSQMSEMSDSVTLSVSEKPKPTVIVTPQSSVYTGDTVTLSCNLMSTGWTFFWSPDQKSESSDTNTLTVRVSNEGQVNYYCNAHRGNYDSEWSEPATITVRARPKSEVKVQPADHDIVFTGETVTFSCDIKTGGSWVYHWFRDNNELSDAKRKKIYKIIYVKESHEGVYTCNGTQSSDPQYTETSDAVTLTVSEKPKPQLTSSPKGDVLRGNSVTLYCTLTSQSAGWKFYWSKYTWWHWTETETTSDSNTISLDKVYDRIQYNTHQYIISSVRVSDGGQYRCRARRGNRVYYTDYSNELSLNVIESPKPTVTINPDTQVFIGETVTFRCDVEEGRDTEWTYGWFRDSNPLYPYSRIKEFSISSVTDSHHGQYTCRGRRTSDSQMSEKSDPVTLSVSEKPKPQLTSSPKGDVLRGNSVTLSCTLTPQSAGWKFHWYKYTGRDWTETKYTETDSYTISSDNVYYRIQYRCRAGRGNPVYYTDYSNELSLNVIESPKPTVTINPDTQVFIRETVTFRCDVEEGRDTEWTYGWFRDSNTLYPYSTKKEFSIRSVTVSHGGQYTCRGRRTSDSQMSEMSDSVTLSVSGKPKPTVTVTPQNSVYTGDNVTLSCNLVSTGWTFFWYKGPTWTPLSPGGADTNTHTVTVFKTGRVNYYCRAHRGNYDSDWSVPGTITVTARPKPKVKVQPAENGFVYSGETVTFSCEIKPGGSWEYHWFRDNNELRDAKGKNIYIISGVEESHEGVYTCKGTQSSDPQYTETSDAVTLTVSEKPKPQLTSNPRRAALTGNSVTLYCTLTPPSAGWKFYWSKYTGRVWTETKYTETGSYTISSVILSDGGQYRCRARRGNPVYYTDYSNELSLTVTESPKPTVTINPDTQVFIGETVTFRCDVEEGGDTEWTYDWFRDSNTLYPYSTTKEFSISDVTNGQYTCRGRRTSDSQMSEMSDSVTLSVSKKPKPQLTSNLKGDVLRGNSVTLYCTLTPQSAGWKFHWYKYTGRDWTETKYTETDSYTISSVILSDGGQYKCRARIGNPVYYTDDSNELSLNVIESPKPTVTINPDTQVFIGETVTFRCDVEEGGDTEWTYNLFRDSNPLYQYATTKEFSVRFDKVSHRGQYTCRGRRTSDSQLSEMSDPVTLSVSEKPKPELTSDLKGAALTGNSVILSCTLTPQSAGWKFYWTKPTQSSETETETHQYIISSVRVSEGGQYRCRAGRGNPVYYTDYSDELWVNVTGESSRVSLIIRPSRTQHFTADSLSLSCEDQSDSTGWTVRRYTQNETSSDCSSVSGSTCNIGSLSTSHTGVYWCQSVSGERSNSVNITVHNGDVILDSPVHPVTEGHRLILRCLNRSKLSESRVYFYKNNSILQNQTTGEMIISSVSMSDEGFYHCKHPERGESPKSWVSVKVSAPGLPGLFIGLSLACLFVIIMILLILFLLFKKKKGVQSPSPAVNQDTNQPAVGDNVYANTAIMTTDDAAAASSNTVYPQVMARKKKQNDDAARGPQDVLYSQIEMKLCNKESDAKPSDVTYAEIDTKQIKKPKRKQGKSSEGADTVYSELKQNTDKEDLPETGDVTYAQVIKKGKKG
ncbi:immunoglobulin superfamily member 1-like [Tachysurus fulvidraco]|uniref:immunoglobulin superfamily member 1-like n=1 Tax=Tachysurus fulvidraco TaxID=1234273 RepID=UPI001FEE66A5|nr:immunoglobulin superfamily member 1-like [Tachysurus fulvidraco]